MPYARTYGRRMSSTRHRSSARQRGEKKIWTYETVSISVTGGLPARIEISATLLTKEGITDPTNVTYLGSHYSLNSVPQAAPAAGTRDNLVIGILRADNQLTNAQMDPSTIAVRDSFAWALLLDYPQPYTAAPVAAGQVTESNRMGVVKAMRLIHSKSESIFAVFGSQNAAQSWHIDGLINSLWLVR